MALAGQVWQPVVSDGLTVLVRYRYGAVWYGEAYVPVMSLVAVAE